MRGTEGAMDQVGLGSWPPGAPLHTWLHPSPPPAPAASSPPTLQSPPGCWGPREVLLAKRRLAEGGRTARDGGRACNAITPAAAPTAGRERSGVRPLPGHPLLLRFAKFQPDLTTTARDALGAGKWRRGARRRSRETPERGGWQLPGRGLVGRGPGRSAPISVHSRGQALPPSLGARRLPCGSLGGGRRWEHGISAAPTSLC